MTRSSTSSATRFVTSTCSCCGNVEREPICHFGDRRRVACHGPSLGPGADGRLLAMSVVKPFRAVRYDGERAGPLGDLVAPPYDVIGPDERREYLERSPYNVVHLTLPDSEEQAGHAWREWLRE